MTNNVEPIKYKFTASVGRTITQNVIGLSQNVFHTFSHAKAEPSKKSYMRLVALAANFHSHSKVKRIWWSSTSFITIMLIYYIHFFYLRKDLTTYWTELFVVLWQFIRDGYKDGKRGDKEAHIRTEWWQNFLRKELEKIASFSV